MILFTLIIALTFTTAYSATYYVDAVGGNDFDSGLSSSDAWKTISKVNSELFNPGDNILFKRGQKWREQLNVTSQGSAGSAILFGAFGEGEKPIISGADLTEGFTKTSNNIWRKNTGYPQQVFFDGTRGYEQTSLSAVNGEKKWYWSPTTNTLYIYSPGELSEIYFSPGIETPARANGININVGYIVIENLQVEKTHNSGIKILSSARNIIVDNITLLQWTVEINWEFDGDDIHGIGGIDIYGSNCEIRNSTLGRSTGNDIADQGWAGFLGIFVNGPNNKIYNNKLYHSSTENENRWGQKAYGIRLNSVGGTTEIYDNYIYHVGSHGILVRANTNTGDIVRIYNNLIEYAGQAGISAFRTRKEDGIGGTGFIYNNRIAFANRLGGDVGGGGIQASGIHMNDGEERSIDPARPFMKWYVFQNVVHNSETLKLPNGQDSGGISLDFNANEVEVYRNLVYNNWGKGIYIWNSSRCKIYYNIIYGNDTGTTVTAATNTNEVAEYNEIYNNTYYKNYNTDAFGPNYNTEIYFGGNGKFNIFRNNILYGHEKGLIYYFRNQNTEGCIVDHNIVYKEDGLYGWDSFNSYQTYGQWKNNHPEWDNNSINADPLFVNANEGNFLLHPSSPAINKGINLGFTVDYFGNPIVGNPDIGAVESSSLISRIKISPDNAITDTSGIINFTAYAFDADSTVLPHNNKDFTWTLTNPAVGVIDSNGNFSGKTEGITKIIAHYKEKADTVEVNVTAGKGAVLIDGFENFSRWEISGINLNSSSISMDNQSFSEGNGSLKINYNFTYTPPGENFIIFNRDIFVSGTPESLLLDFSPGNSTHQVSFLIADANDDLFYLRASVFANQSSSFKTLKASFSNAEPVNPGSQFNFPVIIKQLVVKLAGGTQSEQNVSGNFLVDNFRVQYSSGITSVGNDKGLITAFALEQNFPNPFNPYTLINYSLSKEELVSLKIYDAAGREIAQLVNETKPAGSYSVKFNSGNINKVLASGVYLYILRAGSFVQTRKMVLLK